MTLISVFHKAHTLHWSHCPFQSEVLDTLNPRVHIEAATVRCFCRSNCYV